MTVAIRRFLLGSAILLLAACSSTGLRYHHDFGDGKLPPSATVRVAHSASDRHFSDADALVVPMFYQVLAEKGYPQGGDDATLALVYEVRKERIAYVEQQAGNPALGVAPRAEFTDTTRGGIALLLVDVASGKTVYTASTSGEVQRPLTRDEMLEVVHGLLKKLPQAPR